MKKKLELVVEEKEEHDEDIAIYVRDKLTKRDEEIEKGIFRRHPVFSCGSYLLSRC